MPGSVVPAIRAVHVPLPRRRLLRGRFLCRGASAAFQSSTAIGANATTIRANQMAFGTATNTYTAAGITSAASKLTQSGPTQIVTSDGNGNLATVNTSISDLQADIRNNSEGVAMALAMSGGPTILPECKMVAVSANVGGFEGEAAGAFSGVARLQGDPRAASLKPG